MPDREKVISDLEEQITWIRDNDFHKFPGWGHAVLAMRDALALLKAQEQEIEDLKQEIEGHKDNLRETLDEMMRYADELKAQEQKCRECGEATSKAIQELQTKLKAQEPVKPRIVDTSNSKLYHNDMFKNYYCGNCGEFLHVINQKDMFCSKCGKAVKWE